MSRMGFIAVLVILASAVLKVDASPVKHQEVTAEEVIRKTVGEKFPDIRVDSVSPSGVAGLYEIVTPTEIVYTDAQAKHLIIGQIMDTRSQENLTQARWNALNKIAFNSLPFEQAITIVKGNGQRKLAIFADPFCPFCKEFEQSLQEITDVTLYVFLFPLENVHPGATEAARDIWCSQDRARAWVNWMQQEKAPTIDQCANNPLESLAKLGEKLKINSTPTLFFADGVRVPGAISADRLEKMLARIGQQQ